MRGAVRRERTGDGGNAATARVCFSGRGFDDGRRAVSTGGGAAVFRDAGGAAGACRTATVDAAGRSTACAVGTSGWSTPSG
jgi:hypothetical protein